MGNFAAFRQETIIDFDELKKQMGLGHLRTETLRFEFVGDMKNPDRIVIKDLKGKVLKSKRKGKGVKNG